MSAATDKTRCRELENLLRRAMRFVPRMIDGECGNCEGTPCDDFRPSNVCQGHRWLKDARKILRGTR